MGYFHGYQFSCFTNILVTKFFTHKLLYTVQYNGAVITCNDGSSLHRVVISEVNREVDASGRKSGPVTLATVNGLAQ